LGAVFLALFFLIHKGRVRKVFVRKGLPLDDLKEIKTFSEKRRDQSTIHTKKRFQIKMFRIFQLKKFFGKGSYSQFSFFSRDGGAV